MSESGGASAPPPAAPGSQAPAAAANEEETKSCVKLDERTIWTRIWQGIAAASMAVNIVAMALEGSAVAIVAGVIAVLIAPVVIYLQFQLQDTETLRTIQNELRKEAGRLHKENLKLSTEITQLEVQVGRLEEEEKKLAAITEEQGSNVTVFVKLVKENGEILKGLKSAIKADLTQTLVTACIDSDFDSSGNFSDQEIKILEMRMKNVPGVKVNHELLVKTVHESNRRLGFVLSLVGQLEREDLPDEERIFEFDEKETLTKKPQ